MERQPRRRIPALIDAVVSVTGQLALEEVLRGVVEAACAIVGARYAALGVVGEERQLDEFVHTGLPDEVVEAIGDLPHGKGVLGLLIRQPTPLRLKDLRTHPQAHGFPPHHPPMATFLGAPIRVDGQVFGNLYVTEKLGADEFTDEDEELVVALAAVAGVAVHNARLYERTRLRERWLEAVRDVTRAHLQRRGEEELLSEIARCARELVDADVATVAAAEDGDPATLRIRVAHGAHADELRDVLFPREPSISGEVMLSGETVLVDDVSTDPRASQPLVSVGSLGATVFVPLRSGETTFGTLSVANLRGRRCFSADDVRVIEILAAHASIALEYEQIQRRARAIELVEERDRIGTYLQGSAVRRLLGAGLSLEQLAMRAEHDDPELARRLIEVADHIHLGLTDIREMVFGRDIEVTAPQQQV